MLVSGVQQSESSLLSLYIYIYMYMYIYLYTYKHIHRASLVAQLVKNPPAMLDTWVRSLGWEDLLEKGMASHSSILAWMSIVLQGLYQI